MLYNNNRSRVVYGEMAFGVEKKETEQSCDDTDESIRSEQIQCECIPSLCSSGREWAGKRYRRRYFSS